MKWLLGDYIILGLIIAQVASWIYWLKVGRHRKEEEVDWDEIRKIIAERKEKYKDEKHKDEEDE